MTKRIYCYNCGKLVHYDSKIEEEVLYSVCCRCGRKLYRNKGVSWESIKDRKIESFVEPILSPMKIDGKYLGEKKTRKTRKKEKE